MVVQARQVLGLEAEPTAPAGTQPDTNPSPIGPAPGPNLILWRADRTMTHTHACLGTRETDQMRNYI